tara:strand:- start:497 stop:835 length:339 start_codon:yes stop_codon:yes gene_type:complete
MKNNNWNRIMWFIMYMVMLGLLIKILILNDTLHKQEKELESLKTSYSELESQFMDLQVEHATAFDEVIRLEDENNIFTSMFGMIETEPGGHEILSKLWKENMGMDLEGNIIE